MLLARFVGFVAVLFDVLLGCELVVGGVRGCLFWRLSGFGCGYAGCGLPVWCVCCGLLLSLGGLWLFAVVGFRGFVGLVTVVWLAVGWSVGLVNSAGLLS